MRVLISHKPPYVAIFDSENELILQGNTPELLEIVRLLIQKGSEMGIQISVDEIC